VKEIGETIRFLCFL